MRSSVSYMLSHGSGEPAMSHPDYEQQAHHHSCLLILIRGIGSSKPRSLQKVFERVQRVNNVKIKDSAGNTRDIWVRYVREYPVENNDWGDFQTHRRLLGLITIGKFDSQTELNELCRIHESLKVKYTNTLFDSRCILFGSSNTKASERKTLGNISPVNENGALNCNEVDDINTSTNRNSDAYEKLTNNKNTQSKNESNETSNTLYSIFKTPPNFKSSAIFYPENDNCADLEKSISEFINSIFWILESKRLERTKEKIEKVALLLAPFEKKDFVGLDMDTRNMRKRCVGRVTKHLADLTLQSGLVAESLALFQAATETLRAITDSLWLGAANEGLCAASAILLYPNIRYTMSLQRNASLQENSPQKQTANRSTSQENVAKQVLNKKSNLVINLDTDNIAKMAANPSACLSSSSSATASSSTSSVSSMVSSNSSVASSPSLTNNSHSLAPDVRCLPISMYPPNMLKPSEIASRYRDAIINYSKYRHAGIIETEAALKAARICIEQNQNLDVAMFLQNVLYINLNMTELERVQRFETLTELYQSIGYIRKAAFCQRLAAWRHVAQSNTNPDWSQSYRLMLESFPGHKLSLDPLEVLENNSGWPCLQIDLLQQLVVAARRLGHSALATRHMTFLLQTMWDQLSPHDQKEMSLQLQSLSAQCEGAPVPLVLENGTVIPPANLTDLPYCQHFQLRDLPPHQRPYKVTTDKVDSGPFLFTPIHFSSIDRRAKKNDGKITFQWIQNDICQVTLKLKNPLPYEVKVSDMRLLTNGIVFESLPETVILPTAVPTTVTLQGTPIEYGTLEIQGYSTHTLGVKSNCRLKHMTDRAAIFPPHFTIDVIPALPKLNVTTSLPPTETLSGISNADNIIASTSVTIFNGESTECILTLTNTSNISIEFIDESIQSSLDAKQQNQIFSWSSEAIQSQLPIKPNESITVPLKIFGAADFLGPITCLTGGGAGGAGGITSLTSSNHNTNSHLAVDGMNSFSGGGISAMSLSGHTSLPSRMGSPINLPVRRSELTSSFRSANSGHSSLVTLSLAPSAGNNAPRQIEAQFRIRYSGGDGYQEGYCRTCAVLFNLEFLPSAQITNWDVLPAETPSQFYLVLDVVNLTSQEMLLNYTTNKNIVIEAKESCRVPVPVERCPLMKFLNENNSIKESQMDSLYGGNSEINYIERACSQHIADQVNLKWALLTLDTKGIASLEGISLSSAMLSLITVAPLQWNIYIDDAPLPSPKEISCSAGQNLRIKVEICNQSPTDLKQLLLSIQFYQDYQNGICNYRLETRVTTSGPNEALIKTLRKNEKISHEFTAIFFTPGRYKADIQCSNSSLIYEQASSNFALVAPNVNAIHGYTDIQSWRYIPAPEIAVTE